MREYLMQWDVTSVTALAWEYKFSMPSEDIALDYAKRVLEHIPACAGLYLFCIGTEEEQGHLVAYLKAKDQRVVWIERD